MTDPREDTSTTPQESAPAESIAGGRFFSDAEFNSILELFRQTIDVVTPNLGRRDNYERRGLQEVKDRKLYHYTAASGLQGVLEEGCFHATAAYFMNDASEVDYGCDFFADILDEWCQLNKERETLGAKVLRNARSGFRDRALMRNTLAQIYVVCFCEQANLLSQWRTYGQTGGYSIGFDRIALEKFRTERNIFNIRLEKVIYEQNSQREILEALLVDSVAELGREEIDSAYRKTSLAVQRGFAHVFVHYLETLALREIVRFKHPAFREESEWRLIAQPPPRISGEYQDAVATVKFRPSHGVPTPYIELRPEGDLLPITSVRYGPTLERKRVEHALAVLLRKLGYPNIELVGSEIPVRL